MKHLTIIAGLIFASCAALPPGDGHVTLENATSQQTIAVEVRIGSSTYPLEVEKGTPEDLNFGIPPGDTVYVVTATVGAKHHTIEEGYLTGALSCVDDHFRVDDNGITFLPDRLTASSRCSSKD